MWGSGRAIGRLAKRRIGNGAAGRAVPLLVGALTLATGCWRVEIVTPETKTQLPQDGTASVTLEFEKPLRPESVVGVKIVSGFDEGSWQTTDVTDRFVPAGGWEGVETVSAELTPADGIAVGRNVLLATLDYHGHGFPRPAAAAVSWEPEIDAASADRCEVLDPRHCLLPFPSNVFTRPDPSTDTALRVNIHPDSTIQNADGVHVDPTDWNLNDGFSPGTMVLTHIPEIDLAATGAPLITDLERSLDLDNPFAILDAATHERQLFWAELDSRPTDANERLLILRPGKNLKDGHTYTVVLSGVRDAQGDPIPPPRGFRVFRDGIPTFIPAVEERRPVMEALLEDVEAAGFPREDVYLAWQFTVVSTRSLSERLLHMRDDAFADLGAAAPSFAVTSVSENHNARVLRRVDGTFQVPLYLTNGGASPARLVLGPDGLPQRTGTYAARFRCIVPRAASADGGDPVVPARISLYGHGLLGSRTEVGASHVEAMADEHDIIFCATDWIGMASDDVVPIVVNIIPDFSNFPALPDRLQQAYLNTLFLGRLMKHPDGLSSHPAFQGGAAGTPLIDGSDLFYDGNSQGAVAGGGVAAFAQDWTRLVLGVPGMNYSTLLRRSADFNVFLTLLTPIYIGEVRQTIAIAMAQMLWDRSEASGHANHLTSDTYPDTPAKKVLLQAAFGDFQVANVSAEVEARSIGASIHQPALAPGLHWEDTPYFGIPPIGAYPFDGSALVYWDSGNLTPPDGNVPPGALGGSESACALDHGGDPHECPRRQGSARLQKSEFLKTGGAVVDVCGGAPCLAPNP